MSQVRLDVSDYVAVVTIDNPPVNAQNMDLVDELIATLDRKSVV